MGTEAAETAAFALVFGAIFQAIIPAMSRNVRGKEDNLQPAMGAGQVGFATPLFGC